MNECSTFNVIIIHVGERKRLMMLNFLIISPVIIVESYALGESSDTHFTLNHVEQLINVCLMSRFKVHSRWCKQQLTSYYITFINRWSLPNLIHNFWANKDQNSLRKRIYTPEANGQTPPADESSTTAPQLSLRWDWFHLQLLENFHLWRWWKETTVWSRETRPD